MTITNQINKITINKELESNEVIKGEVDPWAEVESSSTQEGHCDISTSVFLYYIHS